MSGSAPASRDAAPTGSDLAPVEVVVVAYGAEDLLARCLEPLAGALPVTVVDNASSDRCREACARLGVRYLDAGANLGFAGGVNLALDRIEPERHVLLLNPDARIEPDGVRALAARLDADPSLAAVAPRQMHPDTGAEQRVAWPFPSPGRQWRIAVGLGRTVRATDFLVGAALLLDHRALAEVGPLDERFFLYAEETDWQRRAAARGWRVALVPEVTAFHVGGGTSAVGEVQQAYFHAAGEIYVRKWFGPGGWQLYRGVHLAGDVVRWASGGSRRAAAGRRLRTYLRGPVRHRADVLGRRR